MTAGTPSTWRLIVTRTRFMGLWRTCLLNDGDVDHIHVIAGDSYSSRARLLIGFLLNDNSNSYVLRLNTNHTMTTFGRGIVFY